MEKLSYKLKNFEGPLDLLLILISKNKLNIYDIQISVLLDQYMEQIRIMQEENLEIESEFFEMASRLVYIKSVMLLPQSEEAEKMKEELTGQLVEYQLCKLMAEKLVPMVNLDRFVRKPMELEPDKSYRLVHSSGVLVDAYIMAAGRGRRKLPPDTANFSPLVARKIVSVNVRMIHVLRKIYSGRPVPFEVLFNGGSSRSELVATFLAVLELVKTRRAVIDDSNETIRLSDGAGRVWKSRKS